jgi:hypothetical protein
VAVAEANSVLKFKGKSGDVCAITITKNGDNLDVTKCDLKFHIFPQ